MTIFQQTADSYWAEGLSVIPLAYNQKRPILDDWTFYCRHFPDPHTQSIWKSEYGMGNIGLATGPQSNIIFLDVDTENPKVLSIISTLLPSSPWKRIGQKGYAAAYRYSPKLDKSFQIKDEQKRVLVELIANKRQLVLPPSIHPDTQKPYVANCELTAVHRQLPSLPDNLESLLREAFAAEGIALSHSGSSRVTDFVAAGGRDNAMISLAGLCSMDITRGRMTLQESFDRMSTWYESLTEKVAGDALDIQKGHQKIIEFLERDVCGKKARPLPLGWDKHLDPTVKAQLAAIFKEEHEEWAPEKIKKYIHDMFMIHTNIMSKERYDVVEYALGRVSRSPSLSSLHIEMILKYIVDVCRIPGITLPNLRKRLKEMAQGDIDGTDHTEIARETLKHLEQFGDLRFQDNLIWQWKGSHWQPLEATEIHKHIAEEFGNLAAARKHSDHVGILKVMENLLPQGLANNKIFGVNFANYFLTIDGEELPHLADLGCTFTMTYRHTPEHTSAPMFMQLLQDCWGHDPDFEDKVKALQEMICATLFGMGYVFQRVCLLYGQANSGKSTVLNVIKALFPSQAVSVVPPDVWADKFAPTMMYDKVLNVCGELPEKREIDGKSFKEIVDGSEVIGQHKGKPLFKFCPKATHWFASNYLPKTRDTSEGFNRRILVLHFNKPITGKKKVLGLHNLIIENEREAIASWAILAAPRLMANKDFTLPSSHVKAINEMASENNSVRFFLLECPKVMLPLKMRSLMGRSGTDTQDTEQAPTQEPTLIGSSTPSQPVKLSTFLKQNAEPTAESSKPSSPKLAVSNGLNLTSEERVYSEYIIFCSEAGGVRSVGLRQFRKRMQELEHEFGFKVHTKVEQDCEVHSYEGVIIAQNVKGKRAISMR